MLHAVCTICFVDVVDDVHDVVVLFLSLLLSLLVSPLLSLLLFLLSLLVSPLLYLFLSLLCSFLVLVLVSLGFCDHFFLFFLWFLLLFYNFCKAAAVVDKMRLVEVEHYSSYAKPTVEKFKKGPSCANP